VIETLEHKPPLSCAETSESSIAAQLIATGHRGCSRFGKASGILGLILAAFVVLQCFLPLGTAIKIGADEDYELSKPTLCLSGYKLYTEVWDDQPPLYTFLITQILKHVSPSVLGPRLLTVGFAAMLVCSTYLIVFRIHGLLTATIASGLLIVSPGFLELSCSVMQEIPALAPLVLSLFFLLKTRKLFGSEILSGLFFAIALQLKLIGIIYFPLVLLILWLRRLSPLASMGNFAQEVLVFGVSLGIGFVALNFLTGSPLGIQLKQSWAAHFSSARSSEYGSASEHPYDWSVLLKNWDITLPALLGVVALFREWKKSESPMASLPLVWLALSLVVFSLHKPWWEYYYVHNALPLCWCAAVGLAWLLRFVLSVRGSGASTIGISPALGLGLFALCALPWMAARVYGQVADMRVSPKIHSCYVLKEVEKFKPFTTFMFTDRPIYSFHSGIPVPPHLATLSLKRFWTGDMSNARLTGELESIQPGLVLWSNDSKEVPFQELLSQKNQLAYIDEANRLFVHKSIIKKVKRF